MAKYHVTAKGLAAPCKATERPCPLGGEDIHGEFNDVKEAQKWVEEKLAKEYSSPTERQKVIGAMVEKLADRNNGEEKRISGKEILSLTNAEWTELAQTSGLDQKRYREQYEKAKKTAYDLLFPEGSGQGKPYMGADPKIRAQVDKLREQEEAARIKLNTAYNINAFADKARILTSERTVNGKPIPAGWKEMPVIFDLDGNVLAPQVDTRMGPQTVTLPNGAKVGFRASTAEDPEKRRRTEAAKGFVLGKAIMPVEIKQNTRGVVKIRPDFHAVRKDNKLMVPTSLHSS